MKLLTDKSKFEKWFIQDYLRINSCPLNPSIFTDEELESILHESLPESFPCLVFFDSHDARPFGEQLRYVYKKELRLMQKLLEGNEFTH
ncbi:hypothetical protein LVQ78_07955 [Buttiauxella sp. A2-C2_NF]|uniref:hypothetical protein n=1 Tax=Buttiauxella ferragutiae TaxID=82989 RepID=UPI001E4D8DC6|nr:hypothetical protein [Buttiauxella ferragutiae]MCE0825965.1 hypothetical protein [Buttiauxella ferragutiae]